MFSLIQSFLCMSPTNSFPHILFNHLGQLLYYIYLIYPGIFMPFLIQLFCACIILIMSEFSLFLLKLEAFTVPVTFFTCWLVILLVYFSLIPISSFISIPVLHFCIYETHYSPLTVPIAKESTTNWNYRVNLTLSPK